jgi:hypothetical protein
MTPGMRLLAVALRLLADRVRPVRARAAEAAAVLEGCAEGAAVREREKMMRCVARNCASFEPRFSEIGGVLAEFDEV